MSDTVLRTIDLTKRYKNRLTVDHLNIEVRRGDVFGFLGPNGAGESTTIRMILHLVYPTAGDMEIFGTSLKKASHQGKLRVEGGVQELLKRGASAVLVKTDRPEEALGYLKANAAYRSAVLQSDGLLVELDPEQIPELKRQLVGAGFGVSALVPRRTLENYFLNLIEGREA